MILQRKTKDRIADIEQEIRGVKSLYNITSFETQVMATLKTQDSASEKQFAVLDGIERKVFGKTRAQYEVKQTGSDRTETILEF